MNTDEKMTGDLFEVDKRLSLKPVVDFNAYLRNAFGDGPCTCVRCAAAGGVDGIYLVPAPMEDGQPSSIHRALMLLMRHVVENGLKKVQYALDMPKQGDDGGKCD